MKDLLSRNELVSWQWNEKNTSEETTDQVTDYFQCISDCEIIDSTARRFCRHILTE